MSLWMQLFLQDPASPSMMMLSSFHDLILMMMILVIMIISYMIMFTMTNKLPRNTLKEAHKTELLWTSMPAIILLMLATPSLHILYLMDESDQPSMTIKTIGHQWFWSYEYSDFPQMKSESFMTSKDILHKGEFRLLEVDNRMIIPMGTKIRLLVTPSDVIHSWTVPALGMKIDAIPGRLNQLLFSSNRAGVFYGQCSEICGANHSFMPIVMESINMHSFLNWSMTKNNSSS